MKRQKKKREKVNVVNQEIYVDSNRNIAVNVLGSEELNRAFQNFGDTEVC